METLRYVVLVNGLLAVVSVAYYLLLRQETFFRANRLVLWLGAVSAFLLPLLELPDWRPQPVRAAMQQTARVIVPKLLSGTARPQADVTIMYPNQKTYRAFQAQEEPFSWSTSLLGVYLLGAALLLIRFSLQLLSLRKLIRQSVHEPYDDFVLVQNAAVNSPFSFFRWVVLNPNQHTSDELEQILRHERVHVREQHSIDMLAVEFICLLFWFNPAVYLFRQLIHQILEFSADRAVLDEGVDVKAYQYNLLKVSLSSGQSVLTNHFSKSQLKSRISMLNAPTSAKVAWLKYPVFFLAVLTVASAFAKPQHVKALSKYLEKPVMDALDEVVVRAKKPNTFVTEKEYAVEHKAVKPSSVQVNDQLSPIPQVYFSFDTVSKRIPSASPAQPVDYPNRAQYDKVGTDTSVTNYEVIDDKEMEEMILTGQQKYGHLGIGPRRFGKEEIKQQSSPGSYLKVNADGSLSVDETVTFAKIFINNKPVSPEAVRSLTINQLYTLAVIYGYQPVRQDQAGTRYISFTSIRTDNRHVLLH